MSDVSEPIVNGKPAPEGNGPQVLVGGVGSGTLVTPNLIVTARHVLANDQSPNALYLCDPRDAQSIAKAGDLTTLDSSITIKLTKSGPVVATVAKVFSPPDTSGCIGDIAFGILDHKLQGVKTLPIRLSDTRDPLVPGEMATIFGWGATSSAGQFSNVLLERDTPILMKGPGFYRRAPYHEFPISSWLILLGSGACFGDSGGGVVRKSTGALIGVMTKVYTYDSSVLEQTINPLKPFPYCDPQNELVVAYDTSYFADTARKAFAAAGYAPWVEGRDPPKDIGESCQIDDDCKSGLCATAGGMSYCSQSCATQACPAGYECATGMQGDKLCVPPVPPSSQGSWNCAISHGKTDRGGQLWLWLAVGSWFVFESRRRCRA